jgi:hypothetical protein
MPVRNGSMPQSNWSLTGRPKTSGAYLGCEILSDYLHLIRSSGWRLPAAAHTAWPWRANFSRRPAALAPVGGGRRSKGGMTGGWSLAASQRSRRKVLSDL